MEVNNYNNIHDYLTSFCIYVCTNTVIIMALVDPSIDQCEGDVSSMGIANVLSVIDKQQLQQGDWLTDKHANAFNKLLLPRARMRSKGLSNQSWCLSVCLSVCL